MKEIKPWERGDNKKNNISIDDFKKSLGKNKTKHNQKNK